MQDFNFNCSLDTVNHTQKPTKQEVGAINNRIIKNENYISVSFDSFVDLVTRQGRTFLPARFQNETRNNANWENQFMFCLDIEHGETLQEALDICKKYEILPNIIYTTFSHTEEDHRFRIIWFLEEIVEDIRLQKFIQLGLMKFFKGSDKACKDRTRMFNGSANGAWYINKEELLTVPKLFVALNNYFRQDNNAAKNTINFAKTVGVNLVNGYLDAKVINVAVQNLSQPNIYISSTKKDATDIYSRAREPEKHYTINFSNCYSTPDQETYDIEKVKSKKALVRNFDFLLLNGKCRLFREGINLTHKIEHEEMFGMFTNLLAIQGSDKYVKTIIENILKTTSKTYEEKFFNIENTVRQIKKVGYEPMKCCNYCPFYAECTSESTMIEHTKKIKNTAIPVKNEIQIREVEEVREDISAIFDKFASRDNGMTNLTVVKAPTGTGKTEAFINIVSKIPNGLVYAAPTHKLIRDVAERLKQAGFTENVDFMVFPELPEDFEERELIEKLYSCGAHKRAGAELQRIAKTDAKIKEYLDCKRRCESFDKLVLITHQRLIYSPLKTEPKKYVIDEDIILNTMFPVQRVKISDFTNACFYLENQDFSNKETVKSFKSTVLETNKGIVEDTPRAIFLDKDEMVRLLLPAIKTNRISSNILNLFSSEKYVSDNEYIYYIKRNNFNVPFNSDILILSATVNRYFTEAAYPNAEFIDLGQIKYKGNLYQIPARSLSRTCIRTNFKGYSNYAKLLCQKYLGNDYNTITFPEFLPDKKTDRSINLWNCLGLDYLQDKDLAVIGTPHCPEIVYFLLCSVLGLNVNNAYQDYRKINRNGFEFDFQTYSNSFILSEIQLYMIESVLMQCIGRARLINNPERKVLLLSNFILPQAQVLNYTNQEVKELTQ